MRSHLTITSTLAALAVGAGSVVGFSALSTEVSNAADPTTTPTATATPGQVDPANTYDFRWIAPPPASVGNNKALTARLFVNANDAPANTAGSAQKTITLTAQHGIFIKPVGVKDAEGVKRDISADGRTCTVTVTVPYGATNAVDVPIKTDGDQSGDKLTVSSDMNGRKIDLTPVGITFDNKANVIMGKFESAGIKWISPNAFPKYATDGSLRARMSVWVGAETEPVGDTIEFDVKVTSNKHKDVIEGTNVLSGYERIDSSTGVKRPDDIKVEFKGNGTYHVTMTGFEKRIPTAVEKYGEQSKGVLLADGSMVFNIKGASPDWLPIGINMDVTNFKMSTEGGTAIAEDSVQDNHWSATVTPEGDGFITYWLNDQSNKYTADRYVQKFGKLEFDEENKPKSDLGSQFLPWSGNAVALPGDYVLTRTASTNSLIGNNNYIYVSIPQGVTAKALYTNVVNEKGNASAIEFTGFKCSTTPDTGNPMKAADITRMISSATACPADVSKVKTFIAFYDRAAALKAQAAGKPDSAQVYIQGTVDNNVKPDTQLWTAGSIKPINHDPDDPEVGKPSYASGPTRYGVDVLRVVGSRVYSQTAFDKKIYDQGNEATVTLTSGWSAGKATKQTGKIQVVSTLPAGVRFVSADVKPESVKTNPDGTTTLTWPVTDSKDEKDVIYKVKVKMAGSPLGPTEGYNVNTVVNNKSVASDSSTGSKADSSDNAAININARTQLFKTTQQTSVILGKDKSITWDVAVENRDVNDQPVIDVVDALPMNGKLGSKFSGTIGPKSIKVVSALGDKIDYDVYTTTEKDVTLDPADKANGALGKPSSTWTKAEGGKLDAKATGVRVLLKNVKAGDKVSIQLETAVEGSKIGDVFINNAGARATHTELLMLRSATSKADADGSKLKVDKRMLKPAAGTHEALHVGDPVEYEVTVLNDSDKDAYDVTVTDKPGTPDLGDVVFTKVPVGTISGGDWKIESMKPHEKLVGTVTAKIQPSYKPGAKVLNLVSATNPSNPPKGTCTENVGVDADTDQCDAEPYIPGKPNLKINKVIVDPAPGSGSPIHPGDTITYKVEVLNDSDTGARDVKVTDKAGTADLEAIAFKDAKVGTVKGAVWLVGNLKAHEKVEATVSAKVSATYKIGTKVTNLASVESPDNPPTGQCEANPSVESDTDQCDVEPYVPGKPRLKIDKVITSPKADSGKTLKPGDPVTYKVTVLNDSKATARDVVATDKAQTEGLTAIAFANPSVGKVDGAKWLIGTLKPGQKVTASVNAKVADGYKPGTKLVNLASVESPDNPPTGKCVANKTVEADTDQCDVEPYVPTPPSVKVDKSLAKKDVVYKSGDAVTYTLTAKNASSVVLHDVHVIDTPDKSLTDVSIVGQSKGNTNGLDWAVGDLKPGETVSAVVRARVVDQWDGRSTIRNTARVTSPDVAGSMDTKGKGCTLNEGVDADNDRCDYVDIGPRPMGTLAKTGIAAGFILGLGGIVGGSGYALARKRRAAVA